VKKIIIINILFVVLSLIAELYHFVYVYDKQFGTFTFIYYCTPIQRIIIYFSLISILFLSVNFLFKKKNDTRGLILLHLFIISYQSSKFIGLFFKFASFCFMGFFEHFQIIYLYSAINLIFLYRLSRKSELNFSLFEILVYFVIFNFLSILFNYFTLLL